MELAPLHQYGLVVEVTEAYGLEVDAEGRDVVPSRWEEQGEQMRCGGDLDSAEHAGPHQVLESWSEVAGSKEKTCSRESTRSRAVLNGKLR